MPADALIHVGDVGTVLKVRVRDEANAVVDVSAATGAGEKLIYLTRPDGTEVDPAGLAAAFTTDGTDGWLQYTTLPDPTLPDAKPGTLDQNGTWRIEAWVDLPGGEWSTGEAKFYVAPSRRFPGY